MNIQEINARLTEINNAVKLTAFLSDERQALEFEAKVLIGQRNQMQVEANRAAAPKAATHRQSAWAGYTRREMDAENAVTAETWQRMHS